MSTTAVRERPIYSMRLDVPLRRLIEAAAAQRGETLASYIRRTATDAARRDLRTAPDEA
jgi:uncharacterized protein (DUF1778 family)